ncbi:MAG TPA: flagellar biosynthetic protein FliO [Pirellulales bacterium]|nr:flagellar biosynthetic protein FliO [Pirellulales bacterium]
MSASNAFAAPLSISDDSAVRQATYQSAATPTRPSLPPTPQIDPLPLGPGSGDFANSTNTNGGHRGIPAMPSSAPAIVSMFGSLAVVIGLFLGLVWLLKRGSPKSVRLLSKDVVELLGRAPLAGRQQMHVIRFGNRLLLVAVSPDGAKTLAEISDAAEVDRLAGLCQQTQANSATQAFRQIFGQLAELRRPNQLDPGPKDRDIDRFADTPANAAARPAIGIRPLAGSLNVEDDDV